VCCRHEKYNEIISQSKKDIFLGYSSKAKPEIVLDGKNW
jgi:hypothetical protein